MSAKSIRRFIKARSGFVRSDAAGHWSWGSSIPSPDQRASGHVGYQPGQRPVISLLGSWSGKASVPLLVA
jgi:hypothetical protein